MHRAVLVMVVCVHLGSSPALPTSHGEVSTTLRKISPWCTSSLGCLLKKRFWIGSGSYLFSVPRWPTHPSLPGNFPSASTWKIPHPGNLLRLEKSGSVDHTCFHGQTQTFLCALFLHQLQEEKKNSKNVFSFTSQFWGKLI